MYGGFEVKRSMGRTWSSSGLLGKSLDRKLAWVALKVFAGLEPSDVDGTPQKAAFSLAKLNACGDISTACALKLPGGQRWQRRLE